MKAASRWKRRVRGCMRGGGAGGGLGRLLRRLHAGTAPTPVMILLLSYSAHANGPSFVGFTQLVVSGWSLAVGGHCRTDARASDHNFNSTFNFNFNVKPRRPRCATTGWCSRPAAAAGARGR
jgi:hypothetical protein